MIGRLLDWLRGKRRMVDTDGNIYRFNKKPVVLPALMIDRQGIARMGSTYILPEQLAKILGEPVAETLTKPRPEIIGFVEHVWDGEKWVGTSNEVNQSMQTCGTCKYFGEPVKNDVYVPTGYHVCQLIKRRDNYDKPTDPAVLVDASGYYAALCIKEEFGCNQWEQADETNQS